MADPLKVVYLFGAGATHAELLSTDKDLVDEKNGLLLKDVSARVIDRARREKSYLKNLETVSSAKGFPNIELLISLIENSKVEGWEEKSRTLKSFVKADIKKNLGKKRVRKFYLHKALLELHEHRDVKKKEKVVGIISLNYDDILDQAYKKSFGAPNYGFSVRKMGKLSNKIPLLKLHGSFNWNNIKIGGKKKTVEIIPLGANKNYLHSPYNFIWNHAMEILIECNVLRVIGCSLHQNDLHLIDLLFKAHIERTNAFFIEVIAPQETGETIRRSYGFFPEIKTLTEIGSPRAGYNGGLPLIGESDPGNVFETWLRYKADRMLKEKMKRTKHLRALLAN